MWTFGRKLAAGFSISLVLLAVVGATSYRTFDALTSTSEFVTHTHTVLEHTGRVLSLLKDAETGQRGFVITGDDAFLDPYTTAVKDLPNVLKDTRALTRDNPSQQRRLDEAEPLVAHKVSELARTIEMRRSVGFEPTQKVIAAGEGKRAMDDIRGAMAQIESEERDLLRQRTAVADGAASTGRLTIMLGTLLSVLLTSLAGFLLVRSLTQQIGSAVQHVQSSSAELQAAANQQVAGAREQATAMTEISTTISELLATSRQIAESSQRVARISTDAAAAARSGDDTMQRTEDAVGGIKKQVDVIVEHTLDLGKKSQQIGGILSIIDELSEQTNILAINASIEAAGAGEMGRRFGVVAEEIRKLADRVGGSSREIRVLVDDIRGAVNTTVMATESGAKAVDAGRRHFSEVALSFRHITGLVGTTSEVAREIELSTKQQASAVEQVTLAVKSVSQSAKESEASSTQTFQTSSELTNLSRNLTRLVQSQPGA
jgi:methyl-accepting chemotaxis protein